LLQPLEKSTLADWLGTPNGEYVLRWERGQIDVAVEDIFGFNALQIGLPTVDFLRANRIPYRYRVAVEPGAEIRADARELPIASQSVDLVVLPHVLEFSDDPHRILREVDRVMMPEGQLVITGFNPLSLWGAKRKLSRRSTDYPWCGDFIGLLRLRDWLKLLGFELNGGKFGCYAPPARQSKWLQRFSFMERAGDRWWPICGGVYVVRAVKRVQGMRIVTPAWRQSGARVRALATVAQRDPSPDLPAAARRPTGVASLRLISGGMDAPKPESE
jgi:SAM-dependent methyltransferase